MVCTFPSDRNVVYKLCMHTQRPWVFVLPNAYSPFFTLCWVLPFPSLTFLDCILHSALLKSHYECTPLCWLRICIFSECHPFAQPKTLVNILNAVRKSRDAEWSKKQTQKSIAYGLFYELLLKLKLIKHQMTLVEYLLFKIISKNTFLPCFTMSQYLKK